MGELIMGRFSGRAVVQKPADENDSEHTAMNKRVQILGNDVLYIRQVQGSIEAVRLACRVGDEAARYLFGIADSQKKDDYVDLRKGGMQERSLEELCDYLGHSHKGLWQAQPHYFGALILEINERLKILEKACEDIELPRFMH